MVMILANHFPLPLIPLGIKDCMLSIMHDGRSEVISYCVIYSSGLRRTKL